MNPQGMFQIMSALYTFRQNHPKFAQFFGKYIKSGLPEGSIVETNCVFTNGFVDPIVSKPLPAGALSLVRRNCDNIDLLSEGIAERDRDKIFASFINQPLCAGLGFDEAQKLFKEMWDSTGVVL